MLSDYILKLVAMMMATAAVFAAALSAVMPRQVASALAVVVAILAGRNADKVTRHFKTDVEHALRPDEPTLARSWALLMVGMLAAYAAPLGLMVLILAVHSLT